MTFVQKRVNIPTLSLEEQRDKGGATCNGKICAMDKCVISERRAERGGRPSLNPSFSTEGAPLKLVLGGGFPNEPTAEIRAKVRDS